MQQHEIRFASERHKREIIFAIEVQKDASCESSTVITWQAIVFATIATLQLS